MIRATASAKTVVSKSPGVASRVFAGGVEFYAISKDGKAWMRPDFDINPSDVILLHHFMASALVPKVGQQVTINAYDENDQQKGDC